MDEIEEARQTLREHRRNLDEFTSNATTASSDGSVQITEAENRTITTLRQRIDRLVAHIEQLRTERGQNNGGTSYTPISYEEIKYRKWTWKLMDLDFTHHDFGAALEIDFAFGKVNRGGQVYWILDGVTPSPQSTTGLKLEVSEISSKYYSIGGNLEFTINIQFKLSTADVSVSTTTGVGFTLGAEQKQEIGASLPNPSGAGEGTTSNSNGVSASLNLKKEWTRSQVLPGSATTVTRIFTCTSNGSGLSIVKTAANNVDPSGIDDPGMDIVGSADWDITTNDSSFVGSL
jgi:hypothetical protein